MSDTVTSNPVGVYPRGCGGAENYLRTRIRERGLSPRVRGSLQMATASALSPGSIPAGAGEPFTLARLGVVAGVYPRGCGGAHALSREKYGDRGLSPRVRGSQQIAW